MTEFNISLAQDFLVALLIGALIGIEREKHKRNEHPAGFGGLRTFILFSMLGAVSAWLSRDLESPWLFIIAVVAVAATVITAYLVENRRHESAQGLISEISAIMVCLLGGAVMYGHTEMAVSLAILISAVLAFKQSLHNLVEKIGNHDLYAVLKLLIASFIVLPLLPNYPVDPLLALNPYKLWLLVIMISAMSLVGYVAVRWLGNAHGSVITGITGGLASSTALTLSFARNSKIESDPLAADIQATGILAAWFVMFIRVLATVGIVFSPLLPMLLVPYSLMIITTAILAGVFFWFGARRYIPPQQQRVEVTNPFSLVEAVKFGSLFAAVLLLVKIVEQYASPGGLYFLAALAGLTDVDAINLSMSEFARQSANDMAMLIVAAGSITIATLSNTVVKCGLVAVLGSKALTIRLLIATVLILLAGAIGIML